MPVLLARGCVGHWDERDRLSRCLHAEFAVQALSPWRIADLVAGKSVPELDLLCCSVTTVKSVFTKAAEGQWFAAVSPNRHVCAVDEALIVPLSPQAVQTVMLCALHLQASGEQVAVERHSRAVRVALEAAREARGSDLRFLEHLPLGELRDIACRRTCVALLSALVPTPPFERDRVQALQAHRRSSGFSFDDLPVDLQITIAAFCAVDPDLRLPDLALVNHMFRRCASYMRQLVTEKLNHFAEHCNAIGTLSVGAEVALRGLNPMCLAQRGPRRARF